jgi:protein-arginine kinase activator protein McsA
VKCPIYIDEAVVDEAGISVKMVEEKNRELKQSDVAHQVVEESGTPQMSDTPTLPSESEMGNLKKLLDSAIEEENYEEAARIRDRIRDLENT